MTLPHHRPLLYYITDRRQFSGTDAEQRRSLLGKIREAAAAGIDFIQLREKDLAPGALESLAREAVSIVRESNSTTRLLINSRTDIALATRADGVHLTSTDLSASDVRSVADSSKVLWTAGALAREDRVSKSGSAVATQEFLIAVSCHCPAEVRLAESHGADFAVLAPIFGKVATGAPGIGLPALREATQMDTTPDLRVEAGDNRTNLPVLALGGVTLANAHLCLAAGAAGIAAIRLFQENNCAEIMRQLQRF